jgi:hypothetical protein
MLVRRLDWRVRLAEYLAECATKPFRYGQHDCALFAGGALAAVTGVDLTEPYRGRYATIRGGLRVLRRSGYDDAVALAAAHLRARDSGETARPGDLAVVEADGVQALGVVQGGSIYLVSLNGLVLAPLAQAQTIFEVSG